MLSESVFPHALVPVMFTACCIPFTILDLGVIAVSDRTREYLLRLVSAAILFHYLPRFYRYRFRDPQG
jgi:hypothetical protein